jgi:hypothetical protein
MTIRADGSNLVAMDGIAGIAMSKKNQMCHGKNTMIKGWLGHPSHFGNPDMRWIFIYIMIYIYI